MSTEHSKGSSLSFTDLKASKAQLSPKKLMVNDTSQQKIVLHLHYSLTLMGTQYSILMENTSTLIRAHLMPFTPLQLEHTITY